MKWIYGKQDLRSLERSEENCFLMTNGLGGFSSLTMAGGAARNDHSVFMACTNAPNHRYNMIHRLKERLYVHDQWKILSTQEFANKPPEEGYCHVSSFTYEDTPLWRFDTDGVEIIKEMGLAQEENTWGIRYVVHNRTKKRCTLEITPFLQFTPKGHDLDQGTVFTVYSEKESAKALSENFTDDCRSGKKGDRVQTWHISANDLEMTWHVDGRILTDGEESFPKWDLKENRETLTATCKVRELETYFYSYDAVDGRRPTGTGRAVIQTMLYVPEGSSAYLDIVCSMENDPCYCGAQIIEQTKQYRRSLSQTAGFKEPAADALAKAANQFVSLRASTGGKTILAGFPFFEDWGRDTMIALPGVCLSTGQYKVACSILRTFAAHEKHGLMPNLFPEGGNEPMYNTADAALLFINCVYLYEERTKDTAFAREMFPVMERIIQGYKEGTLYGIHMDTDGLICAGQGLDQVTWMDVRVGDVLPTPRHGKPVEINAYWYNALKIMEYFSEMSGRDGSAYKALAQQVKKSFIEKFWREDAGCLRDVLSPSGDKTQPPADKTSADEQIRCNQIWAVSMPFTMLDREKEKKVVEKVYETLYTPCGLRTLSMDDPDFHPVYQGETFHRDMAYHQGTVWVFPLGAYYLAYLKVHDYSFQARHAVRGQLAAIEGALREGCIGQLPEIYDGAVPGVSKGCFAQAWSVGEMLRVYESLEKKEGE